MHVLRSARDGILVGALRLSPKRCATLGDVAFLRSLCIARESRRAGLGTQLVLQTLARDERLCYCFAYVDLLPLYRRAGFEKAAPETLPVWLVRAYETVARQQKAFTCERCAGSSISATITSHTSMMGLVIEARALLAISGDEKSAYAAVTARDAKAAIRDLKLCALCVCALCVCNCACVRACAAAVAVAVRAVLTAVRAVLPRPCVVVCVCIRAYGCCVIACACFCVCVLLLLL